MWCKLRRAACATLLLLAPAQAAFGASGQLKLLTYNVAGVPDGVMTAHPSANMPRIGELFEPYDLVLVQEDFAYPEALRSQLSLPHRSDAPVKGRGVLDFGDGLSQFARRPFSEPEHQPWSRCFGILDSYFDCLVPKGLSFSRQELAPGVHVDVYNVHLDAGGGAGDRRAREAQIEQLVRTLEQRSAGSAVIVAGDTNIGSSHATLLRSFMDRAGLTDACAAIRCAEPNRIDRVLFRGSAALGLSAKAWKINRRFVDTRGAALSDHLAVSVTLNWVTPTPKR